MDLGRKSGETVGARLRAARQARDWSTRAAAQRLGVSLRFLNELERGKATVRLDKVLQALHGLGLDLQVVARHKPDLREQVRSQRPLLRAISKAHGVCAMSLFGSAARGDAKPDSDLDFLVELEAGRSLVDLVGVKQDLESLFSRPVDVFTRASLKPAVLATARGELVRVI